MARKPVIKDKCKYPKVKSQPIIQSKPNDVCCSTFVISISILSRIEYKKAS